MGYQYLSCTLETETRISSEMEQKERAVRCSQSCRRQSNWQFCAFQAIPKAKWEKRIGGRTLLSLVLGNTHSIQQETKAVSPVTSSASDWVMAVHSISLRSGSFTLTKSFWFYDSSVCFLTTAAHQNYLGQL